MDSADLYADTQVATAGIAKDQAVDLYRFWRMLTTPAGAPVSYSTQEINYLYSLQSGLFVSYSITPADARIRTTLAGDRGLGILLPEDRVTVVGHSLGGHLAQVFTQMFPTAVEEAYTFNAPGFGGGLTQLVEQVLWSGGHFDIPTSSVANIVSEHGPDITSGLGVILGSTTRIFNEKSSLPVDDHFIEKLTDSLSLYDLFQRFDSNASIADITDVLDAGSNVPSRTLESVLDSVRAIVSGQSSVTATPIGDRTQFYVNLLELHPQIASLTGLSFQSLARMSATEIAERALSPSGQGYRYALDRLLPYAISGMPAVGEDASLVLADREGDPGMSRAWVRDRADLLSWINVRNATDGAVTLKRTDNGPQVQFTWTTPGGERENLKIVTNTSVIASQLSQVFFGGDAADSFDGSGRDDSLHGGAGDDRLDGRGGSDMLYGGAGADQLSGGDGSDGLYGGAGDDVLDAGAGENHLEGGPGFDRYVISSDSGVNVIEDSDGIGEVLCGGARFTGGAGSDGIYWNEDRSVFYTFSAADNGRGVLDINGQAVVLNFANGDLGIQLSSSDAPQPAPESIAIRHYVDSPVSEEEQALLEDDPYYEILYAYGSAANDVFQAGPAGGPYFDGRGGDDVIQGGDGFSRLFGGPGDDRITGGLAGEEAVSLDGLDMHLIAGEAGRDIISGDDEPEALYGDIYSARPVEPVNELRIYEIDGRRWTLNAENDLPGQLGQTYPTVFPDVEDQYRWHLAADTGPELGRDPSAFLRYELGAPASDDSGYYDDRISGNGGDDFIAGGAGSDKISGGDGDDVIFGDDPVPTGDPLPAWGGISFEGMEDIASALYLPGDDSIEGGAGNDFIYDFGGRSSDVEGGPGDDVVDIELCGGFMEPDAAVASGYALARGGDGNDIIIVSSPEADLFGDEGDDLLGFEGFTGFLAGGPGDDQLYASGHFAQLDGGAGNDQFWIDDAGYGSGFFIVVNAGGADSDVDTLYLPFDSTSYVVSADDNDLLIELGPASGEEASAAADFSVRLVDWFVDPQIRMDRISFADGIVWSAENAEHAIAETSVRYWDIGAAVDFAEDPGEPVYPSDELPQEGTQDSQAGGSTGDTSQGSQSADSQSGSSASSQASDSGPPASGAAQPAVQPTASATANVEETPQTAHSHSPPADTQASTSPAAGTSAGTQSAAQTDDQHLPAESAPALPQGPVDLPMADSESQSPPVAHGTSSTEETATAESSPSESGTGSFPAVGAGSEGESAASVEVAAGTDAQTELTPISDEQRLKRKTAAAVDPADTSVASFVVSIGSSSPSASRTSNLQEEDASGQSAGAFTETVNEMVATFFANATPPPMSTQEWLNNWFPAGARQARESVQERVPLDLDRAPAEPPDATSPESMSPEQVQQRYDEIDAWFGREATEPRDEIYGFVPLANPFGSMELTLQWGAGMSITATVAGMAQLGGHNMRPLQGISEGFVALG